MSGRAVSGEWVRPQTGQSDETYVEIESAARRCPRRETHWTSTLGLRLHLGPLVL
jgi:hypothetical protein